MRKNEKGKDIIIVCAVVEYNVNSISIGNEFKASFNCALYIYIGFRTYYSLSFPSLLASFSVCIAAGRRPLYCAFFGTLQTESVALGYRVQHFIWLKPKRHGVNPMLCTKCYLRTHWSLHIYREQSYNIRDFFYRHINRASRLVNKVNVRFSSRLPLTLYRKVACINWCRCVNVSQSIDTSRLKTLEAGIFKRHYVAKGVNWAYKNLELLSIKLLRHKSS